MDTQRLFLFVIFSFSLVLVWDGWQRYQHPQEIVAQQAPVKVATSSSVEIKHDTVIAQSATPAVGGKTITVTTDTLFVEINSLGGDIQKLELLKHPDSADKTKPFVLFQKGEGTHNYSEQSGLIGEGLPNHNTLYQTDKDAYVLADGSDTIEVKLTAKSTSGISVTKTLTFHKGSYETQVSYDVENGSKAKLDTSAYFQLIRDSEAPSGATKFVPTYTGAAVFTDTAKLQKVDFSNIEKGKLEYQKEASDGWIGILQHYFVSAWIPKEGDSARVFHQKTGQRPLQYRYGSSYGSHRTRIEWSSKRTTLCRTSTI